MAFMRAPKGQARYRDPQTFEMSPALLRVRAPFFWRNTIGLLLVTAVPAAVYAYTWKSLTKDDFGDIPIPPISDSELAQLRKEYEAKKKSGNV
ncbi:cytochrome c oxidase assembly factor 3, mitochondrial [[Candida] anglica]|uniref:Cytochrome c oxidase assembly factor 3 n=1 Tax=[Candida] anglica TaxID=148631 RepID=A0ABP0EAT7_9ASCO